MKTLNQFDFSRIIIVAYRLPFKLIRKKDKYYAVQNSGGLVSAILSLSEKIKSDKKTSSKIIWVGTGDLQLGKENLHPNFELFPVEIPRRLNEKYYGGFCNDTIWPLFHYFPSRTVYDNTYFDAYLTANNLFFRKVRDLIQPGDLVWIHDYQLFLLPGLLREAFPQADIGFFLHIPFPSFEMFRLLPRKWREIILKGMTGADVIGFHTSDYTQHFIKSVKRILGYKVDKNFISVADRLCKADSFPIGIDFDKFHDASFSQGTELYKKKIRSFLSDNKLIFSVDRLDYSKGLLNRLRAFERFLEKYPEWHFKVVFNMVVIPSRDNIEEYRKIKKEIEATVGLINGKYSTLGWNPLIYQYKSIPFSELIAIYNLSDVGFITPIRDGMNLVAKEYIACQNTHYGMLVLSEMAGASAELNEAIIINPTDTEETSDALNKALIMPEDEKEKRISRMQERLSRYNVFTWTTDFFNQIDEVKKEKCKMQVKYLDNTILKSIYLKYMDTHYRLFLIDYDKTLNLIAEMPELDTFDENIEKILNNIATDSHNTIVIISGRSRDFIYKHFRNLNAILVAEHGYFIKYPCDEWITNIEINLFWKEKILPVLSDYVDRCNGSWIENKYASLVWHYGNADEEIALLRINELKDDLTEIMRNEPKLHVVEGDKLLEIKSILYDKGTVATQIIDKKNYDFIFAIGDDSTDKDLFKVIPESGFTIKIGSEPSNAKFNLRDQSKIVEVLSLFNNTK